MSCFVREYNSVRISTEWKHDGGLSLLLLLFSHWVTSDSLWPHGLQHARLPCPSPSPSLLKLMSIESEMPSNHLIHRYGNSTSIFIVQANDYFLRLLSRLFLCVPAMSFPWKRMLTLYSTDFMLPWVSPPSLKYLKQESMWILRDKIVSKKYRSTFDEHDCVS